MKCMPKLFLKFNVYNELVSIVGRHLVINAQLIANN